MENEKATGNKMGYEPVGKLLLSMGIPMIISMAIQALYNIVDSNKRCKLIKNYMKQQIFIDFVIKLWYNIIRR